MFDQIAADIIRQLREATAEREALRAELQAEQARQIGYEREADRLSAENAALRTNYETACKLVADMHAAAMGAKVGPVVGVVEDVLRLRAEVEELRAENFALAAGQCVNATADEGGRPYCKELAALRAEVARLKTVPMKYRRMEFNAQLQQENAALRAENDQLKTVMIAAAEEIHAHWDAHCDAEGYGPQNLMCRLEEGIPSEYGYTAGAFAALRADAERYRWLRGGSDVPPESHRWARWEVRYWCGRWWNTMFAESLDAAIDAAKEQR